MFTEQQQKIYRYWNGSKIVKADPIDIQTRLMSKDADFYNHVQALQLMQNANRDNPSALDQKIVREGIEAFNALLEAARYAFKVKPFNGDEEMEEGLTHESLMMLLMDYNGYMSDVKKNGSPSPM